MGQGGAADSEPECAVAQSRREVPHLPMVNYFTCHFTVEHAREQPGMLVQYQSLCLWARMPTLLFWTPF